MDNVTYTAFIDANLLASGMRDEVLTALKSRFDLNPSTLVLTFEDQTGQQWMSTCRYARNVLERYRPALERVGPGRPKLGGVAREISLLRRQWEWLEQQPSGASAAIHRLIDEARKRDRASGRLAQPSRLQADSICNRRQSAWIEELTRPFTPATASFDDLTQNGRKISVHAQAC